MASKLPLEPLLRWSDAFPAAKSQPPGISAVEVAALIRSSHMGTDEFAVIDLRRGDYEGGHVAGSFQRHAQTFYDNLDSFHREFGGRRRLVFYCSSSKGRGPRCGGWYQDYLNEFTAHEENATEPSLPKPEVLVLEGGMKEWLKKFAKDSPDLIEYD
jgi:arsenite methyltransferase